MLISMGLPWTPKGVAGKGGGTKENEGSEKVNPTISKDFCSMIIHGENELTKMNKTPRLFHKNCLGEWNINKSGLIRPWIVRHDFLTKRDSLLQFFLWNRSKTGSRGR